MYFNPYYGYEIKYTCCESSTAIVKLKLGKGKTADEVAVFANGAVPDEGVNHGTKVLKELIEYWSVKVDRVVSEDSYFASIKYEKSL